MQNIKNKIKIKLKNVLRSKFTSYKPESSYMPFHTKLLGKDKIALYSFIQSLNTNFGTSIFEPIAQELALSKFDCVKKQSICGKYITKEALNIIQDIMNKLESGQNEPNKNKESLEILKNSQSKNIVEIKPAKVDLFLQKNNEVFLIDLKTVKPNKGSFKEFKRTLLTWFASYAYENPTIDIHTLIAIPYNPYYPKSYERWTMKGMLDLKEEIKVAEEFWDFLGGNGSYDLILQAFEEVGCEMRNEIDEYFKKFLQN